MSYETTPIGRWNERCWIELYEYLATRLTFSRATGDGYMRTNNQSGGFQSLYWYCRNWRDSICHYDDNVVYLQIHHDPGYFVFRVEVQKSYGRSDIRNECSQIIRRNALIKGQHEIIAPPPYPREGKTMAFARVERENWLGGSNEIINKERVVETLKVYENIFEECFVR